MITKVKCAVCGNRNEIMVPDGHQGGLVWECSKQATGADGKPLFEGVDEEGNPYGPIGCGAKQVHDSGGDGLPWNATGDATEAQLIAAAAGAVPATADQTVADGDAGKSADK